MWSTFNFRNISNFNQKNFLNFRCVTEKFLRFISSVITKTNIGETGKVDVS